MSYENSGENGGLRLEIFRRGLRAAVGTVRMMRMMMMGMTTTITVMMMTIEKDPILQPLQVFTGPT